MARRPNYGFEKRQREIKKQKKKEAKAERKRLKKEALLAEQGILPDADEDLELTDELEDDEAPDEELEDEAPAPKRGFFDT